ncbi:MAG: hypothetical protein ACUVUU_06190 [bacterium]
MKPIRLASTLCLALVFLFMADLDAKTSLRLEHISSIPCYDAEEGRSFVPLGIDILSDGRLIVVGGDNSSLWLVNPLDSTFKLLFDCRQFVRECQLVDVAVDFPSVICSEGKKGTIFVLDLHGDVKARIEIGKEINGIGISNAREILVCLSLEQKVISVSQGFSPIEIHLRDNTSYPLDCVAIDNVKFFVTDYGSRTIRLIEQVNPDKDFNVRYDFKAPWGIDLYLDKYLVISDPELKRVLILDLRGNVLETFDSEALGYPTFLACSAEGLIYLSDQGNLSIEVLRINASETEE